MGYDGGVRRKILTAILHKLAINSDLRNLKLQSHGQAGNTLKEDKAPWETWKPPEILVYRDGIGKENKPVEAIFVDSPAKLLVSFFSGSKQSRKIYLISGASGVGKTLWCMRLFHAAKSRNLDVKGLVSVPVYERDVKTGFNLQDLESGIFKPLGFKNINQDGLLPVGSWNLDIETINWGNQILSNIQKCQILIIDELGPLEFEEKGGLKKAFEILDLNHYDMAILVIRPSLLAQALFKWPSAEVIQIPERETPA